MIFKLHFGWGSAAIYRLRLCGQETRKDHGTYCVILIIAPETGRETLALVHPSQLALGLQGHIPQHRCI